MSIEINEAAARNVLAVVDKGLSNGMSDLKIGTNKIYPGEDYTCGNKDANYIKKRLPGHVCVEAAVCLALDLPHGDNPPCA